MSKLCSLCLSIQYLELPPFPPWLGSHHIPISQTSDLVPFLPKKYSEKGDEETPASRDLGFPLHRSLESLSKAAETCELCGLISEAVHAVKDVYLEALQNPRFTYYNKSGPPKYELFASKRRDGEDGFMVWSDSEKETEVFLLAAIGYCVDDESPLKDQFRGRTVLESPKDPISFDRYRGWLKMCNEFHEGCPRSDAKQITTTLPSRILAVGNDTQPSSQIRLVEPEPNTVAHYATLSHCWGQSPQFTTTRTTLLSHKDGIKLEDLPQSFQDAVLITRELGIPYLWIDSLCICQDDGADWERESAKMADVYRNAHITIAAASSASDMNGFLGRRAPRKHITLPISVDPGNGASVLKSELKLFKIPNFLAAGTAFYITMKAEPLTKRGWALQERYLSSRTLHLGIDQAYFECAHVFLSEDGYRKEGPPLALTDLLENSPVVKSIPWLQYRKGKRWYETLGEYSTRDLSREDDKLPALSGLARVFEEVMGGDYVAGLWKECLVEGLAFQCFGKGPHKRPETWRAPSWSWASVNGQFAISTLGGQEDLVRVKDVRVQVKGENPYGEITDGVLELLGSLEKLQISKEPEHDADTVPHARNTRVCFEGGSTYGHYTSFDVVSSNSSKEEIAQMDLYGIPLAADYSRSEHRSAYVLIVVPDSSRSGRTFRREGFVFADEEVLLQRWKQATESPDLKDIVLV